MLRVYGSKNKNYSRPKKTGAAKKQRIAAQRARLIGFGLKEEAVIKLTRREMRELLKRPKALQA